MNNNLDSNERKRWARQLYTQSNRTIKETAHEAGADEASIRAWINEGSWDTVRTSLSISKKMQLERLYAQAAQLTAKMAADEEISPKDADLLVKYTNSIKNLDTENSVYAIIEAAEPFIEWIYRRCVPLAQNFTREFDLFIKERKAA